ncbi:uncharacterized protein LOC143283399 [Babylonia areolata]|uniref:uncharacterized protein LOC143283399 n=1 Tax=Babylonia areolata TaxID=304850 RepID=UPI003FD4215A
MAKESKAEYEDFEVITDEDREKAEQAVLKELLTYAGYTLLAVGASIFTVVCFLLDPRACLVAFSTGSPCCLIFPCYRNLMQYTDPAKLIRANVNVYVPGIYVEEGGRLREYPPTPEEMDCLYDLVSEFMTVE